MRAATLLLVIASAHRVAAWCCRVCGKCMCDSYGVCAGPPSEARAPLNRWTTDELGRFMESLADGGARNLCPTGCRIPSLFNGSRSRLVALEMDGAAMHKRLQAQSAWEAVLSHPNVTAEEKANATSIRASFASGLLPPEVEPTQAARLYFGYFNRLHMAIKTAVQPLSPPPAPRAPPPSTPPLTSGQTKHHRTLLTRRRT